MKYYIIYLMILFVGASLLLTGLNGFFHYQTDDVISFLLALIATYIILDKKPLIRYIKQIVENRDRE